jgi:hypothetical protein
MKNIHSIVINNDIRNQKAKEMTIVGNQLVGNIGMYYVCYELAKRGWNVMPTSRNARGIDILIYSQDATRKHTIQVKTLSRRSPVPPGGKDDNSIFLADYLIVCRIVSDTPEVFITKPENIRNNIHRGEKDGRISYWLQPMQYEMYKDNWDEIGVG